ncbi:MAG: CHAP domain-containing protein, partial [Enterococcus faecalis]|nr:CHAP domain-containing protein [Enterococcus faecalis]
NSTNNASYHELYQGNTFCGYVNSGAVKDIVSESKFKENPDMNQTDVLKTQDSMDEFIDFDNDGKENKESLKEDITEKNLSSKEESNKEQTEISY